MQSKRPGSAKGQQPAVATKPPATSQRGTVGRPATSKTTKPPCEQKPTATKTTKTTTAAKRSSVTRPQSSRLPSSSKTSAVSSNLPPQIKPTVSKTSATAGKPPSLHSRRSSQASVQPPSAAHSSDALNIKDKNSKDEQVRQFKSLRSQMHQWIYSQDQLEQAFARQQGLAEAEIFERYLQVKALKEQNCELTNLIHNTQKLTVLDATLTIQYEHLPEIEAHYGQGRKNLDQLSTKLEQCLNSLPLDATSAIEDPGLLQSQIHEYKSKLSVVNGTMAQDDKQNSLVKSKLDQLASMIRLERQALSELTQLARERRVQSMQEIAVTSKPSYQLNKNINQIQANLDLEADMGVATFSRQEHLQKQKPQTISQILESRADAIEISAISNPFLI